MGLDEACERVWNTVYKWIKRELRGSSFTEELLEWYYGSLFVCDGGLLCFVPPADLLSGPVLLGNPSTEEWRVLPCLPYLDASFRPIIVQLVMEEDLTRYKVDPGV